jgi:hypothetical protein
MAQDFGSAASGQSVEAPAWCIFRWDADDGTGATVSVSFNPGHARSLQYQLSPLQKVNIAVNNSVHIFQLAPQEPFQIPIEFVDIGWADDDPAPNGGQGFLALMSFIRYTLNYHEETFQVTTPDGVVEQVRYMGGLDSFREAAGQAQKHNRWNGTIFLTRVIT